jgi:multidrug efflux pump subunit AcrA (membrane-fusion protein)
MRMYIKLGAIICAAIISISSFNCAPAKPAAKVPERLVVPVERGPLVLVVPVDGNLQMPQAYDLRFGAPGTVIQVPEEGDQVKAGKILSRLDDTSQQLDIKAANSALQTVLSNLYETIPGIQQTFNFPSYYPSSSALISAGWARQEAANARSLYNNGKYREAASELNLAAADLESCIKIFQSALDSPQSKLDSVQPFADDVIKYSVIQQYAWGLGFIGQYRGVIESIRQGRAGLKDMQALISKGNYSSVNSNLDEVVYRVDEISNKLKTNVNNIEIRNDTSFPSRDLCFYFYGAAVEKLNAALNMVDNIGADATAYNETLRLARHYMEICNSILGTNTLVLPHGLSMKNNQQYNLDLAKATVTLDNMKDTLLKNIIIAPFDGTVVSVGVKVNDVLSQIDYSSKIAVQLVDTKAIKFAGQVDEIDILKIKIGQKAAVSVDAVPGTDFPGTVTFISPYGVSETTSRVVKFAVTVEFDKPPADLKGNLSATANVSIFKAENVLTVPLTAVTTNKDGSTVLLVTGPNGESEKRKVTLGRQNQQSVEILSGLADGDKVIIEKGTAGAPVSTTRPTGPPPQRK